MSAKKRTIKTRRPTSFGEFLHDDSDEAASVVEAEDDMVLGCEVTIWLIRDLVWL